MLVIADETRAVGLAGIMGGENSEIVEDTVDVVFESANFNGTSIRRTALALGMRTEASAKFEKGLDILQHPPCGQPGPGSWWSCWAVKWWTAPLISSTLFPIPLSWPSVREDQCPAGHRHCGRRDAPHPDLQ